MSIEARKIVSAESEGRSAQGGRTAAAVVASESNLTPQAACSNLSILQPVCTCKRTTSVHPEEKALHSVLLKTFIMYSKSYIQQCLQL